MEKEVSIDLQKKINNYSYNAFYLCLLLNHKGYYPWFYERYIQLCFNQSKTVKFYDISELFLDFYNGLAEPQSMLFLEELNKDDCKKIKINNYVESMIKKGFVVFTYIDEYYINKRFQINNEHFTHDILIYGFDSNKKIFKVMGFDEKLIFHKYEINYEMFQKAFNDGLTYSLENNLNEYYLIRMKLKYGNNYKHIFNLSYFLEQLNQYIFSINNSKLKSSIYKIYNDENNIYGFEIYKYLINYLNSVGNRKSIDYRIFHTLYEQKSGLLERFIYIRNNFDFPEKENYIQKLDDFKQIVKLFENIRLLVIKYNMTFSRDILLNIEGKLKNNYILENELLINIYNKLNIIPVSRIYNDDIEIKNNKISLFKNLNKENFFISNSWKDQDNGSCLFKLNDKLIINHRQYGKNELKIIFKDFCFDFYKDEIYSLSFNFKNDAENPIMGMTFFLLSGWDNDEINILQSIKIEELKDVIHFKFQPDFSGSAFIGFELFLDAQPTKNCFYELSDFNIKGKFVLNKLKDNAVVKNNIEIIKGIYKFHFIGNEWLLINDWKDQEKGSGIAVIDNKMILNHRMWGKNELWLVNDKKFFQIIKNDKFEIIFDLEYFSLDLKLVEVCFFVYFNEIKSIPAYTIPVKPKLKNKVLFQSEFSSDVKIAFKFIWKNQPEENDKIKIGNLQIKKIT